MKTRLAALTLITVFALAGCSESVGNTTSDTLRSASTASDGSPAPEATEPEPLAAETPAAEGAVEAQFLVEARERLSGLGSASTIANATDEQLIIAGHEACDALIDQQPFNDVSVIEGEERVQGSYLDSAAIATAGILFFCPEINGKTL